MKKFFYSTKSQAMMEMAILGPLLLMAFGIVVTYIVKMNNDQYYLMESFRRALKKSHDENKAIAYGTWDDRRGADASNPVVGQKITSSGAGYALWAIPNVDQSSPDNDPQDMTYVKVNDVNGIRGLPIEYPLGPGQAGGIETYYITTTGKTLNVNTNDKHITSTLGAATGEVMIYEINKKRYVQGRVSGGGGTLQGDQ
ncbi:MAG: hypothetical protein PHQ96_04080 [Candidatus Omnitrophica bacterium]|nr:hypothetical protein [Candidatus Omnitrophota bacterium]